MNKIKKYISLFILLLNSLIIFAQNNDSEIKKAYEYLNSRGEVYLEMNSQVNIFTKNIIYKNLSIDKIEANYILAYANKEQFEVLLKSNVEFKVKTPPSLIKYFPTGISKKKSFSWDSYPTYQEYLSMMDSFIVKYPDICSLTEFGTSINGRKLLCIKISDNVETDESEPEFLYTSTIHGDETGGYILCLRLIDYLLSNYGTNQQVDELINNAEIWINPLSNPDGTYYSSDTSVYGATRYNANYVDLNRNYIDPKGGAHPDNKQWQQENIAMMNFMISHNFSLSANFHGGSEVVNYPWDTWSKLHPDDEWFKLISRQYADTVHQHSVTGYLDYLDNGITNGYAWYSIEGGRQDYMSYFLHGREVTIELDNNKTTPPANLTSLWEYNYRSMLNYIEQVLYGIDGTVTDSINGEPVKAKITILNYDTDSSQVYTDSINGYYVRLLKEGSYNLLFTADNYHSKEIDNVSIIDFQKTILDVQLAPIPIIIPISDSIKIQNPFSGNILINFNLSKEYSFNIILTDIIGKSIIIENNIDIMPGNSNTTLQVSHLPPGKYIINILTNDCTNGTCIRKCLIKIN